MLQKRLSKPTKEQLQWADAEMGVLIHYDIQVFEPSYQWRGKWGYQPDSTIFNPSHLNTDQWIRTAKEAGAKYAILVAKHCSGFCLWPTHAHEYSIKNSPWREGTGDIVRDFIESCEKYDIRPGLYYSTSANAYFQVDNPGTVSSGDSEEQERYNQMVMQQVTELWSHYGRLFEIWFDGGTLPPEKGGPDVTSILRKLQPQAICFQGPKEIASLIRWVGNEDGFAEYPCWSTTEYTADKYGQFSPQYGSGMVDGKLWAPAEADVPNRKQQWFWYKDEEGLLLSTDELVECYYKSVGRNCNLLIGMVVDDRGLVPDADVSQFREFGKEIKSRFENVLSETSGVGHHLTINFQIPTILDQIVIMEDIAHGERIREYQIDGLVDGNWKMLCSGEAVGHKRIETFSTVGVTRIRLTVTKSVDIPHIKKFAAFKLK
ncbi:hypothetical protein J14TS2_29730 [Bacillus sp. J14TS2]|uniref:alpha-L-fucosidase n=1 Tax=Bacillus sp. J14TS2 TaxID=2807188 RepID=UPI001B1538BB|nr:alpha-L-fucosidase [Bacillus sp. J14TS2]GIN72498.1 hypothetical protein J14TS2_29730 [Bacillus sp. J14TS2]